jgi:hypothetical protein
VYLHYKQKTPVILSTDIRKLAQQTGFSFGSTRRVLKKASHLHPYNITQVHELDERHNVKNVEYFLWFRDVITANGEDILDVTFFLPMRRGFIYPVTSTTKTATFGQRLIRMMPRTQYYMIRRLVCNAAISIQI